MVRDQRSTLVVAFADDVRQILRYGLDMAPSKTKQKKQGLPRTEQGLKLALQRLAKLPDAPRITDLYYMMNIDGYGEEYLKVYAIIDDRDADPVPPFDKVSRIERVIRETLEKYVGYWVLISFRSQSEQKRELSRRDAIIKPIHVKAA